MGLPNGFRTGRPLVTGHYMTVTAATTSTSYTVDVVAGSNSVIDSIVMTPTGTGADARWGVTVLNSGSSVTLATLASSLPNLGYGVGVEAYLPGAYPIETNQVVRFTYTHSTGTAQTVVFMMSRLG